MEFCDLTITEAQKGLREKEFSAKELTQSCLQRIDKLEDELNAFITVTAVEALKQAEKVDEMISRGEDLPPLAGIPGSVKDLFVTKGTRTTCASKILEDYIPPYTATAVRKLENAGYIMLGKTNMDEFAQGSSTENSAFGPTKNPWDLTRVPGGTSGGAAAAVAAGMGLFALGSDTAGSIRQPCSFCGVVGMKPTYGRVSRYGVVAYGSSLDCPGPIARSVADVALIQEVISGKDPLDATTSEVSIPDYSKTLSDGVVDLKIGMPKEFLGKGTEPEVLTVVQNAARIFEGLGAKVSEISLPHTEYAIATYYLTVKSEVSANLARYDGIRYGYQAVDSKDIIDQYFKTRGAGFGDEVKRGIMLGAYALSAGYYDDYYLKAQKVRTLIAEDFEDAFREVDMILAPVSPFPAFKLGEKIDDPLAMYLSDVYTATTNLAGIPGLALNAGFSSEDLPIGIQLLGSKFSEGLLFQAGYAFEQATDWHKRRPDNLA